MDRIIYKNDNGGVSVVIPTDEALSQHTIQEIAVKDVPAGKPFKIVSVSDIRSDRCERDAGTIDEADLKEGVGGESNEFN